LKVSREATLVAYRAFSDVAGKGAFFLVTVLAARRLSQSAFGIFSLGTTLGWMAAVATDAGIQMHLARRVATSPEDAPRLLRAWLRVRLMTSAVALAIAIAGLIVTRDKTFALALFLFVLVYIVSGLIEFLHYFYRSLSRSDIESTLTLWQRFGTLACAALVLAWRPDVTALAAAMSVPVALTFAYSLRRASRLAQAIRRPELSAFARASADEQLGRNADSTPDLSASATASADKQLGSDANANRRGAGGPDVSTELRRDVLPIGIGIVLSALYFRIDIVLLQMWSGTGSVALYNAVFRLVEALRLFPAAVMAVALPILCRATSTRPLVGVSAAITTFSFVVAALLWLIADPLVPLVYGDQYAGAVTAFRILVASFPLMSLNYALTHQLIGWNGHRAYAAVCAAALVFNVALNARLIPVMSIEGAAWATFWTEALLTAGCVTALARASAAMGLMNPSPEAESLRSRPRHGEAVTASGGGAPRA
jgi:O-antigen/teichoic acid export membrane protein